MGGYPQGQLTRRTGRPPRCPRAPPRPGDARLPCSRGLGPRRSGSAISERTLCRRRAQPPLPLGGGGALPLTASARILVAFGPGSRAAVVLGGRTVLRSVQLNFGLQDSRLRVPATETYPLHPAQWHSLVSVGSRSSQRRGGPRGRAHPLSPAEGELGRPTDAGRGRLDLRLGGTTIPPPKGSKFFLPRPKCTTIASVVRWIRRLRSL